jgi:hypothetical protein
MSVDALLPREVAKLRKWVGETERYDLLFADGDRVIVSDGRRLLQMRLQHDVETRTGPLQRFLPGRKAIDAVRDAAKAEPQERFPLMASHGTVQSRTGGEPALGVTVAGDAQSSIDGFADQVVDGAHGVWLEIDPTFLADLATACKACGVDRIRLVTDGKKLIACADVPGDSPIVELRAVLMGRG